MKSQTEKKKWKMPHGWVIIGVLLLVVTALTYIIPAGSFQRYMDETTGKTIVDATSFALSETSTPVSFLRIPYLIVTSCVSQGSIIFGIILIAGALEIVLHTGMFQVFCNKLSRICSVGGREKLFIPIMTFVFVLMGLTQSTDKFIAFAPLGVMLALTMGYDAIVGVAIVLLGVGISYSAGSFSQVTMIAQQIAELPLYSDFEYRLVITGILYVVTAAYISRYAMRIKADPTKSYLYGVKGVMTFDVDPDEEVKIKPINYITLIAFIALMALLVYGCLRWNWGMNEASALFIWMGIICGALNRISPSEMCRIFIKGAGAAAGASLVVGLGATVSAIMTEGGIIDTCVYYISNMLNYMPDILKAPVMFVVNVLINLLIPSGNGQAVVVMPILTPISDIIGVTRQTTVTAFKLGEGLCNYILPHASALMGCLGLTGVPYEKWMKFMWKLFCIWCVLSMIFVGIGNVFAL